MMATSKKIFWNLMTAGLSENNVGKMNNIFVKLQICKFAYSLMCLTVMSVYKTIATSHFSGIP